MSNIQFQDPFTYTTKLISRFDGGAPRAALSALDLIKRGKIKKAAELLKTIPVEDLCLGCHVVNPKKGETSTNDEGVEVVEPDIIPDESMLPHFLGGPAVGDAEELLTEEEEAVADALDDVEPDEEGKPKKRKKGGGK